MTAVEPAGRVIPLRLRCHDCYEFGHEACGCGECGHPDCGSRKADDGI
jgi:hypothetical protein